MNAFFKNVFPSHFSPFLISKMQIIEKKSILCHLCCCCHQQPQRCSQLCAPLSREGACRVCQTPSCVPSSLWIPIQLHQNHKTDTAMGLRETGKPIANPALGWQDPKRAVAVLWTVRGVTKAEEPWWVTKVLHCPKSRIPSQPMCLSYILCVFITQILHISGYKLLKCIIVSIHKNKNVYAAVEHRNFSLMGHLWPRHPLNELHPPPPLSQAAQQTAIVFPCI